MTQTRKVDRERLRREGWKYYPNFLTWVRILDGEAWFVYEGEPTLVQSDAKLARDIRDFYATAS